MPWPYPALHIVTADEYDGDTAWHALAPQSGWVNAAGAPQLQYRLLASPPNTYQLVGELSDNGGTATKTNGTTICTIPATFAKRSTRPIAASVVTSGGFPPMVQVQTNGNVSIFGIGTSGTLYVDVEFSTDLI